MRESLYQRCCDASSDLIGWVDHGGKLVYTNQALQVALGYAPDSAAALVLRDLVAPEHWGWCEQLLAAAQAGAPQQVDELILCTRSGAQCHTRGMIMAADNGDKPPIVAIMLQDVTAHRQRDEQLRANEERYQGVVAALDAGVVLQHADGSIRESNPSAERILGLSADQLMGRTSIDPRWRAIHEDGSLFLGETHPAMVALRTGQPCAGVVMGVHHPDGTLAWISVNAQPLFHHNESTAYAVVTTFVDITRQRQRDEAIRQQEARYRALFEQSIDAILIATGDGRLIAANHEAMRLFDVTEEELRAGGRLQIQDPEDPRWAQAIHERDSTGMFRGELRFRRRDGTSFPCDVSSVLYRDSTGSAQLSVIIRDISERHRLERELQRIEQQQREILEAIPDPLWLIDADGRYLVVNPAFHAFTAHIPGSDGSARLGHAQDGEVQLYDSLGEPRWFEVITRPISTAADQPARRVGIARNITMRKQYEQEREALLHQIQRVLERTKALYHVSDTLNRTHEKADILQVIVESAAAVLPAHRTVLMRIDMETQTVRRQIEGGPGARNVPLLSFAELMEGLSGAVLRDGQPVHSAKGTRDPRESIRVQERRQRDQAGSILVVPIQSQGQIFGTLTAINPPDDDDFTDDALELLAALANDAAIAIERATLLTELQQQATIDSLTQLLNRRAWLEQSERAITMASRADRHVSVLILDADHFKQVNDTYGHPVGDQVLRAISQVLQTLVRSSDLVGRYGGEEFVVLLPETDSSVALQIAERIREAVESTRIAVQQDRIEQQLTATVSIGIAAAQRHDRDLTRLLARADRALYAAKRAGRNCVRVE